MTSSCFSVLFGVSLKLDAGPEPTRSSDRNPLRESKRGGPLLRPERSVVFWGPHVMVEECLVLLQEATPTGKTLDERNPATTYEEVLNNPNDGGL